MFPAQQLARRTTQWRGVFARGAMVFVGLVFAQAALASAPLSIAVRGGVDPQTGDTTMVQPDLGTQRVDFGHVANRGGLRPRTGARVDDEGTSWYIATVELTVVRNADNTLGIQTVRTPAPVAGRPPLTTAVLPGPAVSGFPTVGVTAPGAGALRSSRGSQVLAPSMRRASGSVQRPGGIYIPSASQELADAATHVDVYVRLDGHAEGDASVWFSAPQSGGLGNAVEVIFAETLVARSVAIGEPYVCQISFKVPPSEWGHQNANVRFSARPSGT